MLYIVPTPIGNLGDITLRSIEILKKVDYILAEDTRVTSKLLNHLGIEKRVYAFHAHNEHAKLKSYIQELSLGKHIALVSDAGTPGISDPGFLLIRAAREHKLELQVLPGPTAFVPAVVGSGLPCDKFFFEGFLPVKKGRKTRLEYLNSIDSTIILYESPHKLLKTLNDIITYFGGQKSICVARELSKIHEEFVTDTATEVTNYFKNKSILKGEYVIIVSK